MATSDIDILICEVGLRDGLQNAIGIMPTNVKKEWIEGLVASGIKEIEASSVKSEKEGKKDSDEDESKKNKKKEKDESKEKEEMKPLVFDLERATPQHFSLMRANPQN